MITDKKLDKNSTLLLAAVLVILLGLVSYYFSAQNPQRQDYLDSQVANLESQDNSTDVTSIERDLNNTQLQNLDKELGDIEKEIDGSY